MEVLKSKFLKDSAFLWLGTLTTQSTYIITSVLLARSLGPGDLGKYDIAYKISYFCFFLTNFGLVNVTVVKYSKAAGEHDHQGKVLALASFLKLYLIVAMGIVVGGYFLCPLAAKHFYNAELVGYYGWILCVLGLVDIVRAAAATTLLGARYMKQVALFETAVAMVRVLVLVLAITGGFALAGVIYGSLIATALSSLMGFRAYHLARREQGPSRPPGLSEILKAVLHAPIRHFFSFGILIAINKSIMEIVNIFAAFYMALISFSDTGQLRIAMILVWGLALVLGGVTRNLLPHLGFQLGASGKKGVLHLGKTFFWVSIISGVLYAVFTCVFLLAAPWILRIMYGPEYMECFQLILIIALGQLLFGFAVIIEPFYIYANRLKTCVSINLCLFSIIIVAGSFLGERFGPIGVAWYLAGTRLVLVIHLIYIISFFIRAKKSSALVKEN